VGVGVGVAGPGETDGSTLGEGVADTLSGSHTASSGFTA
jgi:hypothetical protein